MASLGALYEMDLKKIIALSTLRQLGLIIMALRMNMYVLAFFHLLTHALFKASLFLAAGRVIHLFNGRQDVRRLRVVTSCMPITSSLLLICSLSLGGAPFLSAFYSKDKIIEAVLEGSENFLSVFLLSISVILTIIYRFRLVYYISIERFFIPTEDNKDRTLMVKSIAVLSFGGVVGGRLIRWLVLDISYDNLYIFLKAGILYFFVIGSVLGVASKLGSVRFLSCYLGSIWFLPGFSGKFARFLGLFYGNTSIKYWDFRWNEVLGPAGVSKEVRTLSSLIKSSDFSSYKRVLLISLGAFVLLSLFIYLYSLYKA